MKNITILLAFILINITGFAWDSTAAKYMPLQVENQWVYHSSVVSFSGSGTSYERYKISGTQVINGKVYYIVSQVHIQISGTASCSSRLFSGNTILRIDSLTMNLIKKDVCINNQDGLVDSLGAGFGDSSLSCYNINSSKTAFNDSSDFNLFNTYFKSKKFTTVDINGGNDQTYLEGIGMAKYYYSVMNYTCSQILKGCVINGVVYGDTSMIIGINQISTEVPVKYELMQNYPNPFNPVTNIKFSIPNSGFVKLTIYNMLGKEIQQLVNSELNPGTYAADWDASTYPSGVYYYRLEAENYSETKKMVLIK